jgi:hypothetical protein
MSSIDNLETHSSTAVKTAWLLATSSVIEDTIKPFNDLITLILYLKRDLFFPNTMSYIPSFITTLKSFYIVG